MEERKHTITMENRGLLSISGVKDIYSFEEEKIVLETSLGVLSVTGEGLHINRLSIDDGNLVIRGSINSCAYSESRDIKQKGKGFLTKLFK